MPHNADPERPARKVWADAMAASEHHTERARDLLHDAGIAESEEKGHNIHIADRLLLAARIHAELATAAGVRAQAALL